MGLLEGVVLLQRRLLPLLPLLLPLHQCVVDFKHRCNSRGNSR